MLTDCKHFRRKLSLVVRATTTFQGDWFTENLQHVVFSSPKASREGSTTTTTMREQAKRVYLRVAKYLFSSRSSGSGFLWCALFFSSNIIIPPHGKPNACIRSITQQLIPNFSLIVVSVDVSLFFLQFLLFLFPFCCCSTSFWFCFSSFCAVFRVAYFFSGRNHSPIFILSSFVCEQRPQKVLLSGCRCCRCIFDSNGFQSARLAFEGSQENFSHKGIGKLFPEIG